MFQCCSVFPPLTSVFRYEGYRCSTIYLSLLPISAWSSSFSFFFSFVKGDVMRCFLHFFLVLRPKRSFFFIFLCRFSEHRRRCVLEHREVCRNTGKKKFGKKKKTRAIISDDQGHYVFCYFFRLNDFAFLRINRFAL